MESDELICFSSDYPHWDFDSPRRVAAAPARPGLKRKILHDNAAALYARLPAHAGAPGRDHDVCAAGRPRARADDPRARAGDTHVVLIRTRAGALHGLSTAASTRAGRCRAGGSAGRDSGDRPGNTARTPARDREVPLARVRVRRCNRLRAVRPAQARAPRARPRRGRARAGRNLTCTRSRSRRGTLTFRAVSRPTLTPAGATAVEGSDGLLLQVDGQIVPNYDATLVPFSEGDVVTGKVVRIDKDEVLVDIGYKSEGVIPANELSIRKSANPEDEVELGEEVDALVLTKEDQDGRLIMSKKRARFEKAWRRIEAAAESGEPSTAA